jgi:hypothetical protein
LASWIWIRTWNADPDLGGITPAKMRGKNGAKRQKIHLKKLGHTDTGILDNDVCINCLNVSLFAENFFQV